MLDQRLDEAGTVRYTPHIFLLRLGYGSFHSRLGKCVADGGKRRISYDLIRLHYVNFMSELIHQLAHDLIEWIVGYRTSDSAGRFNTSQRQRWVRQLWCRIGWRLKCRGSPWNYCEAGTIGNRYNWRSWKRKERLSLNVGKHCWGVREWGESIVVVNGIMLDLCNVVSLYNQCGSPKIFILSFFQFF